MLRYMPAIAQRQMQGIEDDINCCTTLTNESDAYAPFKVDIPASSSASHEAAHESRLIPCCSPSAQLPVKGPLVFLIFPILLAVHGPPGVVAPAPDDLQFR